MNTQTNIDCVDEFARNWRQEREGKRATVEFTLKHLPPTDGAKIEFAMEQLPPTDGAKI